MNEKSLLPPTAYDARAIDFIEQNHQEIEGVATSLGVAPTAIAGSIARETTSAGRSRLWRRLGRKLGHAAMRAGAFHPFATGPKGGKVGAWIYFGHNYAALGAALNGDMKRLRVLGALPSIAPVHKWRRGALRFGGTRPVPLQDGVGKMPKASASGGQVHAALARPTGGMTVGLAGARDARRSGPVTGASGGVTARAAMLALGAQSSTAKTHSVADRVRRGAGRRFGSIALAATVTRPRVAGDSVRAAVTTKPNENRTRFPSRAVFGAPAVSVLTRASGSAGSAALARHILPSVAPTGALTESRVHQDVRADRRGEALQSLSNAPRDTTAHLADDKPAIEADVARMVRDFLDRQGRLPPSGATGFDPRLTPAWAGQKISV